MTTTMFQNQATVAALSQIFVCRQFLEASDGGAPARKPQRLMPFGRLFILLGRLGLTLVRCTPSRRTVLWMLQCRVCAPLIRLACHPVRVEWNGVAHAPDAAGSGLAAGADPGEPATHRP
jgi:hypothetical protein